MSKRIKELESRCWVECNYGLPVRFDSEKFASLIIRDCVDVCYRHPAIQVNNWKSVPICIAIEIERHFEKGERDDD